MATVSDSRLVRFVNGELSAAEIAELEAELDRRPSLQLALSECLAARETGGAGAGAPAILDGDERLVVGATLGEGGMSTVRQGVQTNLGRAVAVKMLRDETPSGTHRLLQEARLTARLQHPNIVPVHEIVQRRSGELQIVLKHVEGVPWSSVMHSPDVLRERFGVEDALDWNLSVLLAICNALAYAHERGVIHRDVKPSNVMVGHFGEIYLLDWGIAALWGERTDPEIAHVEDAPSAGTLAFMAPEQLEGDADALGPWTDVYLLGATLFEVLAGKPPHAGARKAESRARPRERALPTLPPHVPRELAEIVAQALAPSLEDRLITPQAFRALIESFRSHRGSHDLVARAERSRRRATDAQAPPPRAEAERHLSEAEFGFRAAIEAWPENARAREGLVAVAIHRIDAALADDQPQAARRMLEALTDPPRELTARVARANDAAEAARAEAARVTWQRDASVGVGVRGVLLGVFAPAWVLGWLAFAIWSAEEIWPLEVLLLGYIVLGTIAVLSQGLSILQNHVNKVNVLGTATAVVTALAWSWSADHLDLGVTTAHLGVLLIFALTPTLIAVVADMRAFAPGALNFVCFLFAVVAPGYTRHALAASALVIASSTVLQNLLLRRRNMRKKQGFKSP